MHAGPAGADASVGRLARCAVLLDREDYDDARRWTPSSATSWCIACGQFRFAARARFLDGCWAAIFWFVAARCGCCAREARVREEYTCDREANALAARREELPRLRPRHGGRWPRGVRREWRSARRAWPAARRRCAAAWRRSSAKKRPSSALGTADCSGRCACWLFALLRPLLRFCRSSLFGGPARYTTSTEENILQLRRPGRVLRSRIRACMMPRSRACRRGVDEGVLLYRMETRSAALRRGGGLLRGWRRPLPRLSRRPRRRGRGLRPDLDPAPHRPARRGRGGGRQGQLRHLADETLDLRAMLELPPDGRRVFSARVTLGHLARHDRRGRGHHHPRPRGRRERRGGRAFVGRRKRRDAAARLRHRRCHHTYDAAERQRPFRHGMTCHTGRSER